jgi:hypothetical protein
LAGSIFCMFILGRRRCEPSPRRSRCWGHWLSWRSGSGWWIDRDMMLEFVMHHFLIDRPGSFGCCHPSHSLDLSFEKICVAPLFGLPATEEWPQEQGYEIANFRILTKFDTGGKDAGLFHGTGLKSCDRPYFDEKLCRTKHTLARSFQSCIMATSQNLDSSAYIYLQHQYKCQGRYDATEMIPTISHCSDHYGHRNASLILPVLSATICRQ